jgi:hypothetical protein
MTPHGITELERVQNKEKLDKGRKSKNGRPIGRKDTIENGQRAARSYCMIVSGT